MTMQDKDLAQLQRVHALALSMTARKRLAVIPDLAHDHGCRFYDDDSSVTVYSPNGDYAFWIDSHSVGSIV